ncbi:MAG: Efflux transporter, RND family, MFP subunit [Microgenomates group bacterium Gr01-1014_7]|nr:MAG: Efflux transporter, RND family, MFP subunit [Microgenomates group bacterium Gr01-1014_7]
MKKLFSFLAIVIALTGFIIFTQTRTKPDRFQTSEVKRQDIKSTVSASGTLSGATTVNLHFQTSGKLFSLNVKAGDSVKKGQFLAGLDALDEISDLNKTQNTLRDKEAALRKVYDDIHLFQYGNGGFGNVGTGNETETQRATRTAAEVAKDNAFDEVKKAQKALGDKSLISPVSGIVLKSDFVPGQNVSSSDTIIQLADKDRVLFEAEIDEADISRVSLGQRVDVNLDAYGGRIFEGEVFGIIPQTRSTQTGAIIVPVKITLLNPPADFISGLTGQASIIIEEAKNALTLPIDAVGENSTVLVQTPRGSENEKVITGVKSDTEIEIKTGLNEGEKVLFSP